MSRVTRWLWICLMVLALPVQGMAAAARVHCGSADAAQVQPAVAAGHHAAPQTGHHSGHAAHAAHDDRMAPAAAHHADAAQPATADSDGAGNTPGCSACAVCCAGLAMAQATPTVPGAVTANPEFTTRVPRVVARPAEGPERPPRPAFA